MSRLVDVHGQRPVVVPQVLVHAAALGGLVWAGVADGPTWLLLGVALVVGASCTQAGALARSRWTGLLDNPAQLERALAVESLNEEAVFVAGPVLVTFLAIGVAPAAGLLTALALAVAGTALLLSQRRTEPPRSRPAGGTARASTGGHVPARRRTALASAPLLLLVGTFAAIGTMFGLVEVGAVALTRELHSPGAAGTMLGLWAAGSLAAGVLYGARTWRTPAATRFQISAAAMAAGSVLIAVTAGSGSLVAATAALMAAGTANAPTLITGNALVRLVVPVPNLTEAYTWLGVSVFVGIAAGTAAAGLLVDHHGAGAALWASAVAGALVAVLPVAEGVSSSRAESGSRNGGVIVRVFDAERDGGGYGSR